MINRTNKKKGNFTQIDNQYLRKGDLSLKAKGLLTLILTFPDDWHIRFEDLKELSNDGHDSTRTALNELRKKGYINYYKKRGKEGKFIHVYDVYENPEENNQM